jgi:hypothetical protein
MVDLRPGGVSAQPPRGVGSTVTAKRSPGRGTSIASCIPAPALSCATETLTRKHFEIGKSLTGPSSRWPVSSRQVRAIAAGLPRSASRGLILQEYLGHMSAKPVLARSTRLADCPRWPTMQWLPEQVVELLGRLLETVAAQGVSSSRSDVVSALVLSCDPGVSHLATMIRKYKAQYGRGLPRPRPGPFGVPVVLRVPSPITFRVDGLVASARPVIGRAYRHELIGSLIAESEPGTIPELLSSYHAALAADAVLPNQPLRSVLDLTRPRPGARSMA